MSIEIPKFSIEELNYELYQAASRCRIEYVRWLLKAGADANTKRDYYNGKTPLHTAADKGCVDVVDLLIKANADVNARDDSGKTPLHYAALEGHVEVVRRLVAAGADINAEDAKGNTPLHVALKSLTFKPGDKENKEKTALALINAGAEVTRMNKRGETPLHLAAMSCLARVAEELLRRGALVNAVDEHGYTPLHYAVGCCNNESRSKLILLLLRHGADVNIRNKRGETVLNLFVKWCEICEKLLGSRTKCCNDLEMLISAGADATARDASGITPLHIAARAGYSALVERLLEVGAQPDIPDAEGKTPLDYAKQSGEYEIAKLLIKYLRKSKISVDATKTVGSIKIRVKMKKGIRYIDYEAEIGKHMLISGYTFGNRNEVRKVIRRALKAERPLPNRVKDIAVNVVRQVLLWIDMHKVEGAAAGMTVDLGEYSDLTIYTALYYEANRGWMAELRAVFDGFDGFTDARHRVVETAKLGRKLDDTAADLLLRKLMKVARRAYNIYVEEKGDSKFDRFDDDDDHSDNDDDSTNLKIWV